MDKGIIKTLLLYELGKVGQSEEEEWQEMFLILLSQCLGKKQSALMFATFVPSQFDIQVYSVWGFPGSSDGKDLPAVQETWVQSLNWEDLLGMGMATHSSVLARTVPWAEKPGWLHSMRSQRVKPNWATFTFSVHFPGSTSGKEPTWKGRRYRRRGFDPWVETTPWRRKWQPTPVFLPGESHGQRKLAGYSP